MPILPPPHRCTPPDWVKELILLGLATLSALCGFRGYRDAGAFGLTKQYLSIAKATRSHHYYSESLDAAAPSVVQPEVQREPLYPMALIGARKFLGSYMALRYVQLLAMIAALWLWGGLALRELGPAAAGGLYLLMPLSAIPWFYASVLYPYSFQFLLVTLGVYLLVRAVRGGALGAWLGAGAVLGLASYERGAYLVLPLFLALVLFLFRKKIALTPRPIALFLLVALLVPLPWLLRNARLGTLGMNQMTGYSLGYTFGDLPPAARDEFERSYDDAVAQRDPDNGTQEFIRQQAAAGNVSFSAADRRVASYVLHKCLINPGQALERVGWSVIAFPYLLCNVSLDHLFTRQRTAGHYWKTYALALGPLQSKRFPNVSDVVLFALALLGLALMLGPRRGVAIILMTTLFYTVLFSTTIVRFDPRYRGAADPLLFLSAGYAISRIFSAARRLFSITPRVLATSP